MNLSGLLRRFAVASDSAHTADRYNPADNDNDENKSNAKGNFLFNRMLHK